MEVLRWGGPLLIVLALVPAWLAWRLPKDKKKVRKIEEPMGFIESTPL